MSSMRGLLKIHNVAQTMEAWSDWYLLSAEALSIGLHEKAHELQPPGGAGWKVIDKQIAKLKAQMYHCANCGNQLMDDERNRSNIYRGYICDACKDMEPEEMTK